MHSNALTDNPDVEMQTTINMETKLDSYDLVLPQPIIESFVRFLMPELRKFHANKIKEG